MVKLVFQRVDCVTPYNRRWMFIPLSNDFIDKVEFRAVYLYQCVLVLALIDWGNDLLKK